MRLVKNYTVKTYGLTLPEVYIEIIGVRLGGNIYDHNTSAESNTEATIRVWASEKAKEDGLQPIEQTQVYTNIDVPITTEVHTTVLDVLFPVITK